MSALYARLRGDDDERGVVIILTGLLLTSLLTMTAFAVDIGRESATKRQLHAIADIAAQDGLFGLGPAVAGSPGAFQRAVNFASWSAQHNGHPLTGVNLLTVEIGTWDSSKSPSFSSLSPACSVTLPQGAVGSCPQEATANAVKVVAATTIKWDFISGSAPLSATAIARLDGLTGIEIGTFAARAGLSSAAVDLLNKELGVPPSAGITAVSYQGIANGNVKLGDLATALGFATPSQMLNGNVAYGDLLQGMATVLTNSGQSSAGADMAVIAANVKSTTMGKTLVGVGKIANAGGSLGDGSALAGNAGLNPFDLLTAGADAALLNGGSAVAVNNVNLAIPNVASAQLNLHVLQIPQDGYGHACGITEPLLPLPAPPPCAEAVSAQAESQTILSVTPDSATQAALATAAAQLSPTISVATTLYLPIYVNSASGHGWVSQVWCGSTSDVTVPVDAYAHTGALHLAIGQDLPLSLPTGQTDLTGGTGADTTATVAGQTITSGTVIQFQVKQGATMTPVNIKDLGTVDLLGSGPGLVEQSPPASPDRSFTGAFNPDRGPDAFGAGNVVPGPVTSTGNKLNDAGASLANQLPSASTSLTSALAASGLSAATQATLQTALGPVVVAALNELNGIVSSIGQTLATTLASVLEAGLGGADLTNLPYTTSSGTGTVCLRPQVVQ